MKKFRLISLVTWVAVSAMFLAEQADAGHASASASVPGIPPSPARPTGPPPPILVDDFETGTTQGLFAERKNRLDAFQGTWSRRPSYTVITKVPDTRPGHPGNALRIEYSKIGGWCGWYTLLNGIDVSRHNALTFWVKGEKGGERFDIGMADNKMQDLEIDSVYVGSVKSFLPQGITTEWQQIKVPLAGLRSDINLTQMGSLVLWFRYEGAGAVQIDDVSFVYDPDVERMQKENSPKAKPDPRFTRFSWVWKYDPVNSREIRRDLLTFAESTALKTLFVYLGEDPITRTPQEYQDRLAEFLREAHARGIQIEALQGNPLWALKANHSLALNWVKGYLDFNKKRPLAEKIDGVSLDIEPYLTSEWETGDREKLKSDFIELLSQLRRMVDDSVHPELVEGSFQLGVAIPVFYKREPEFEEALLKQVDYAALMDYYDAAVDIIENARFHINLANRLGKKIVIGVETQDLVQMGQGKRRNTFFEEGWGEMEQEMKKVADDFCKEPGFGGLAIHCYDSYRLLQKGRNVPTRERSDKIPGMGASQRTQPITVDGNLEEWKDADWVLVNKKAQVLYGVGAWRGLQDMSFKVAFQWDPDALYLAIDVMDDALVQEKQAADMWEGDHVEFWLDADLYGDYSEAANSSDDFQIGLSPGDFKNLKPEVFVWVPSVDPASVKLIQIAGVRKPDGYTLEVRVPAEFIFQTISPRVGVDPVWTTPLLRRFGPELAALQAGVLGSKKFRTGFRMGVMVDGSDTDEAHQPQKCLLSSSPERQWGDPTTFNILELKQAKGSTGEKK